MLKRQLLTFEVNHQLRGYEMKLKIGSATLDLTVSRQEVIIKPLEFNDTKLAPKVTLCDNGNIILSYALSEQSKHGFTVTSKYSESFVPAMKL